MATLTPVLDTDELSVFGGPASVDVTLDFGPQGSRGSKIYAGSGEPETQLVGQDVTVNDLYINTLVSSVNYGWLYQYTIELSNPVWIKILKINSSNYSIKESLSFDINGDAYKEIPISSITSDVSPLLADFVINVDIESADPVSFGFIPTITGVGANKKLRIDINALTYQALAWIKLTGSNTVHFSVAYKA